MEGTRNWGSWPQGAEELAGWRCLSVCCRGAEPLPTHSPLSGEGWKPVSHTQLKEPSVLTHCPPRHRSVTAHSSTSRTETFVSKASHGPQGLVRFRPEEGQGVARSGKGLEDLSQSPELEARGAGGRGAPEPGRAAGEGTCRRHRGEAVEEGSETLPDAWLPTSSLSLPSSHPRWKRAFHQHAG